MKISRREFLESSAAAVATAGSAQPEKELKDGPQTERFSPLLLSGNIDFEALAESGVSQQMAKRIPNAPRGSLVCWGLPFEVNRPVLLTDQVVTEKVPAVKLDWLVFLHTTDREDLERNEHGLFITRRGQGRLGEAVADYVVVFADGTEARERIRRRHHIGMFQRHWGENCFQAVPHSKPHSVQPVGECVRLGKASDDWGWGETRVSAADQAPWMNWLWAWKNPHPEKAIVALRFEPKTGGRSSWGCPADRPRPNRCDGSRGAKPF
jgi:hypothetical protein